VSEAAASGRCPPPSTSRRPPIPAIRKAFAAIAVTTMAIVSLAGCATARNVTAAQKLDRAVQKLGEEHSLSFELTLDADTSTLKSLDADAALGQQMPDQVAEFLADARISVSVQSRKPLKESADQDLIGMAMKIGSSADGDAIEYRLVGDYLYLRADPQTLEQMTGGNVPSADEVPESATALRHILAGDWVKIAASGIEQNALTSAARSAPTTAPAGTQRDQVMKALRDVIARQAEFRDTGKKDGVDHITATAPLRTLLTELIDEIRPLAGTMAPGTGLPTDKELRSVPNQKITADFSLKDGALTEVSVNLAKLAKNAHDAKLALVLRVGTGEQITKPAGATQVDPGALMQELIGGLEAQAVPGSDPL